jgi:hypothetical protein
MKGVESCPVREAAPDGKEREQHGKRIGHMDHVRC